MRAIYIEKNRKSKIGKMLLFNYIKRKKKECNCIVIGKKLKEDIEFINKINEMDIPISDGRWLFKFLVIQILEYISKCQDINIDKLRIAIVTSENNELISYYIEELNKINNRIKIITGHREKFYYIEEKLYYDKGIVLEISNNKRKALQDIDVIFNFDFDEERINRYKLAQKAIIVNFKEKIDIKQKFFSGININFYELEFENKAMNILEWTSNFNKEELYESYLYRNDKIERLEQDIVKDNVRINGLIGNKGKILEKEYKNVLDKTSYLA